MRKLSVIRSVLAGLVLAALLPGASADSQIVTDGSLGAEVVVGEGLPGFYTISEGLGSRPGGGANLFHSFLTFDLGFGDTALFTATQPTDNVISRVTGGVPSSIFGTISSAIPGASFYFVNQAGFMFGEGATIDTSGSFHVTTADVLGFAGGGTFAAMPMAGETLSVDAPVSFGFLSQAPASIVVDGASLSVSTGLEMPPALDISLIAGDITLRNGAVVRTEAGRATLVAVGGPGEVGFAGGQVDTSGVTSFADITLDQGFVLATGPEFEPMGGYSLAGSVFVGGDNLTVRRGEISAGEDAGDVDIQTSGDMSLLEGSNIRSGTGSISLDVGGSLRVEQSTIRAEAGHPSLPAAGDIGIRVAGDATFTESLVVAPALVEFNNAGGSIAIDVGGALEMTGTQLSTQDPDSGIDISAGSSQWISSSARAGRRGHIAFDVAGIFTAQDSRFSVSNGVGSSDGVSGTIAFQASDLLFDDSGIFIGYDSSSAELTMIADRIQLANGSAIGLQGGGTLDAQAAESFELIGGSGIFGSAGNSFGSPGQGGRITIAAPTVRVDDSTIQVSAPDSGNSEAAAGFIALAGTDITVSGGSRIEALGFGQGTAGPISIAATGQLRIVGAGTTVSTETATEAGGLATGTISLSGNDVQILDGAAVNASSVSDGNAGTISIDAVRDLQIYDASVTTNAVGGLDAGGGQISISAGNLADLRRATVAANVGSGLGGAGDVGLSADLIALNSTLIRSDADAGNGGNITVVAQRALIASSDTVFDASANTGIDGEILIDAPEVNVESGLTQLKTDFLSASDLIQPSCAARQNDDEEQSSFVVSNRRGLPSSPEGMLVAFDALGGGGLPPTTDAKLMLADARLGSAAATELAASEALRGGQPERAESAFAAAAAEYEKLGAGASQFVALRSLAQTQQSLGRYASSVETLQRAVEVAGATDDRAGMASALGSLGNAYLALGRPDEAEGFLQRGIGIAKDVGNSALAASILNNLGNQQATSASHEAAEASYLEAARLAAQAGDATAAATAYSNAARAAAADGRPAAALESLRSAVDATGSLPPSANRIHLWIHQAKSYEVIGELAPNRATEARGRAYGLLTAAAREGDGLKADRALSYALGSLAGLYRAEQRLDEALYLTRLAQRAAERSEAIDSTYRWYWQAGQILWAQQRNGEAIASYRQAVKLLEETRRETQGVYGDLSAHFRKAVAPVYLDLVDALLASSDNSGAQAAIESTLREARGTVELLKAAELRDYFRDDCIAEIEAKTATLDEIATDAAIVYPVMLPERLDLLVTLPDGIRRYTVPVDAGRLTATAREFRASLQKFRTEEYRSPSLQLYDWLVRPYADELERQQIQTVVFVPDGPLRTIPMSALNDGEKFLVERYALAVTPSLAMVDPQPLQKEGMSLLMAGISESVDGFAPLAMVPKEMEALQTLHGGEALLDEEFQLSRVEQEILTRQPNVVHLASHAVFSGDPETSYVLTHDGRLTMDRLSAVVGTTQFRERPLELLVLSACQTAAGDDRSGLGLAGVAINAGARSAVGSLWSIADEATYRLMVSFYDALGEPGTSKAAALQQAQIIIHGDERYRHPFFWSPFLMINNWQ